MTNVTPDRQSNRYDVLGCIAEGAVASVHLARLTSSAGSHLVAAKRLRREFTFDKDFVAMLGEEARLCAHIRHPNVVHTLNLGFVDGALSLVLEYVEGESLAALVERARGLNELVPLSFAVTILHDVLSGLDAAHSARGEDGAPLDIVHRDVSPPNILVGTDGRSRVADFGIAKARDGIAMTQAGQLRGAMNYMAPERILGQPVTRQADIYAAGVVLWELLADQPLYGHGDPHEETEAILAGAVEPPSMFNSNIPPELDDVVLRAVAADPRHRFATAAEFAEALEPWRTSNERAIGAWVNRLAADRLASTRQLLQQAPEAGPWRGNTGSVSQRPRSGSVSARSGSVSVRPRSGSPSGPIPHTYTPFAGAAVPKPWWQRWPPSPVVLTGASAIVAVIVAILLKPEREPAEFPVQAAPIAATVDPLADPPPAPPPAVSAPEPAPLPVPSAWNPTAGVSTIMAPRVSADPPPPAKIRQPVVRKPAAASPPYPMPPPSPPQAASAHPADDSRAPRDYR